MINKQKRKIIGLIFGVTYWIVVFLISFKIQENIVYVRLQDNLNGIIFLIPLIVVFSYFFYSIIITTLLKKWIYKK